MPKTLAGLGTLFSLASAGQALAQASPTLPIETPRSVAPVLPGQPPAGAAAPAAAPAAPGAPPTQDQPVTFTAEEVEYDQNRALVVARGHVEAWQGNRVLRADEFTYDRNTGVATARGNVQLIEADGQVVFAESVELRNQFKDGVLEGLRGLLAQNGRVAAAGARRTDGNFFDLSRVVYSACDPCQTDPLAPPVWQLRARTATLDQVSRQARYRDAVVEFGGVPLFWTPYLQHPAGSAPRQSGFLSPTFGITNYLGGFVETPYYWAIDEHQDLVLRPQIATSAAPNLGLEYRRRFNFGEISAEGSVGYLNGEQNTPEGPAGHVFSRGRFAIDENWRAGFDYNWASSEDYLRIYRYGARRLLNQVAYTEGFWGTDAYARIDGRAFQGLRSTDNNSQIPYVLPNIYGDWRSQPDSLGGIFTIDTWNFAVFREEGTSTQRVATRLHYAVPYTDGAGGVWTARMQSDLQAYNYTDLALAPNYSTSANNGGIGTANIRAALDWRMPFVRSAGEYGQQVIEPRVQFVGGPLTGNQSSVPNEDSIDFEFTDANLFSLNRFYGRDRQEGGTRFDYALRGAWYFPNGGMLEGLAGASYRIQNDGGPFYEGSGLTNRASDYVARARLMPVSWLEFLGRGRFAQEDGSVQFMDLSTTASFETRTSVTAGYLYTPAMPYLTPVQPRNEVVVGVNQQIGHWRFGALARYDIELNRPVVITASAGYEDECFLLEARFLKSFAEDPGTNSLYPANTVLLFRIGLKTIGDVGFRAI
ncbi:LPS assembly protein LptD [Roseomonas sp. HJA6]|uniref:LPS-assembly protein LptD n=1 Tax=Roseomonas alba TaxID=2846776 RepID=A0ABS7A661_9PROT|nr:LPS assembly protein LptD [Neoroseomonas alba]MBW6397796.1 LPS assembly protein LptD [Neoroseomonas alba]